MDVSHRLWLASLEGGLRIGPMADSKWRSVRWAGFLCPPAGMVLSWTTAGLNVWKRLLATVFLLLYALPYTALIVFLLWKFTPMEVEWRGGFPPVLTFSKTLPDYERLEAHRQAQAAASAATNLTGGTYWTGFRGPRRDGHYTEQPILLEWPQQGLKELWNVPVGGGYASFAIAEGRIFTIEQRRDDEVIAAYDLRTGHELWSHSYPAWFDDEASMGGEGPRATPTWHEGRVYSMGSIGDFKCLAAATGEVLWERNVLKEEQARVLMFGSSASPLIVDDKVLVAGGQGGHSLLAYDAKSGTPVWRSLKEKPAYASPMLVELAGKRQVLATTANHVAGVNIEDGAVLWTHPWKVQYDNAIAQPVVTGPDRFVLSAGYGTGAAGIALRATRNGLEAVELWRNRFLKNKFTSSIHHDGYVYGLDESIFTCLDAATGERKWKDGRYDYGQILLAEGHIIVLSGMGDLILVKATPEGLEERGRFAALQGKTWNHPAISEGRLVVRNALEMACYDVGVEDL